MNYGELKAAVVAYSKRDDLTSIFPTLLELAENRIYYGETTAPKVRIPAMRSTVTLADGTRPTGYLEAIKLKSATPYGISANFVPLSQIESASNSYSVDGDTFVLSTDLGFPLDLTYYGKLGALVDDTDTNELLTEHARVYLASMMIEVGLWTIDDAMTARAVASYTSAANSVNSAYRAQDISGSRLVVGRGR